MTMTNALAASDHDRTIDDRGVTTVADHAVERIAVHSLSEVDNVGGAARRVLGIAVGDTSADGDARVTAHVTGPAVTLDVQLSVTYPASVRATTQNARNHLVDRVGALTGLTVGTIDITVTKLHHETAVGRRVQ